MPNKVTHAGWEILKDEADWNEFSFPWTDYNVLPPLKFPCLAKILHGQAAYLYEEDAKEFLASAQG